jgi:hypothetical protein
MVRTLGLFDIGYCAMPLVAMIKFTQPEKFTDRGYEVEIHVLHGHYCYRIKSKDLNTLTPYQFETAWAAKEAAKKELSKHRFEKLGKAAQQLPIPSAAMQRKQVTDAFFAQIEQTDATGVATRKVFTKGG